jgi:hypothetical protein
MVSKETQIKPPAMVLLDDDEVPNIKQEVKTEPGVETNKKTTTPTTMPIKEEPKEKDIKQEPKDKPAPVMMKSSNGSSVDMVNMGGEPSDDSGKSAEPVVKEKEKVGVIEKAPPMGNSQVTAKGKG